MIENYLFSMTVGDEKKYQNANLFRNMAKGFFWALENREKAKNRLIHHLCLFRQKNLNTTITNQKKKKRWKKTLILIQILIRFRRTRPPELHHSAAHWVQQNTYVKLFFFPGVTRGGNFGDVNKSTTNSIINCMFSGNPY